MRNDLLALAGIKETPRSHSDQYRSQKSSHTHKRDGGEKMCARVHVCVCMYVCTMCVRVCIKINKMEKNDRKKESAIPTPGIEDRIPRLVVVAAEWRLQRSYIRVTRIFFLFLLLLFYSSPILSSSAVYHCIPIRLADGQIAINLIMPNSERRNIIRWFKTHLASLK